MVKFSGSLCDHKEARGVELFSAEQRTTQAKRKGELDIRALGEKNLEKEMSKRGKMPDTSTGVSCSLSPAWGTTWKIPEQCVMALKHEGCRSR